MEALSRLTVEVYVDTWPWALPDNYLAELADVRGRAQETLVLVAVDDEGVVVGGVTYVAHPGRWSSMAGPHQAELRMLAVAKQAQGRGAGAQLVQACVDQARRDGKGQVTLHTTALMPTAQRLYERAGFRRRPEADEWDVDILLLAYVLDIDGLA